MGFEIFKNSFRNIVPIKKYEDVVDFYFNYLSSSHLPISDSISMSYSIELRVPFLSRRLYQSVYPQINKNVILKKSKR